MDGRESEKGDVTEYRDNVENKRGALWKLARGKREQRRKRKGNGNAARAR